MQTTGCPGAVVELLLSRTWLKGQLAASLSSPGHPAAAGTGVHLLLHDRRDLKLTQAAAVSRPCVFTKQAVHNPAVLARADG